MGGLLPSWAQFADSVNAINRPAQMGPVWMEAAHLTGMPINTALWINNPPLSSYPACIAVKAAALQSAGAEEAYLRRLREAAMTRLQDISSETVLQLIAAEVATALPQSFDAARFANDLVNGAALEAFRKDMNETKLQRIGRFPSLVFRKEGGGALLVLGHRPYSVLQDILGKWEVQPTFEIIDSEQYSQHWGGVTERELKEITGAGTEPLRT